MQYGTWRREGQRDAITRALGISRRRVVSDLEYTAPPTCARFMKSEAFGRLIAGPVGSGKTTAAVIELLRRSIAQTPAKDGYSYTRHAIVRQTLKQLKDTVLKDCQAWLKGLGYWKVSENTYHVEFDNV